MTPQLTVMAADTGGVNGVALGVLGALGYLEFGFATVLPLALVLLAAAAAPLAADVRRHRRNKLLA